MTNWPGMRLVYEKEQQISTEGLLETDLTLLLSLHKLCLPLRLYLNDKKNSVGERQVLLPIVPLSIIAKPSVKE
jgi:hypothetical protein